MKVRGWVYVMQNAAMPGLVKVGFSTKDPALRALELGGTGVPHPFTVAYDVLVFEPREVEQQVHARLAKARENKEWFRVSVSEAIAAVRESTKDLQVKDTEAVDAALKLSKTSRKPGSYRCPTCAAFWNEEDFSRESGLYCPNCGKAVAIWR
jgi:predicted RNA-binding Zn-ribbon protein involved in translation (DUF1610 family)